MNFAEREKKSTGNLQNSKNVMARIKAKKPFKIGIRTNLCRIFLEVNALPWKEEEKRKMRQRCNHERFFLLVIPKTERNP